MPRPPRPFFLREPAGGFKFERVNRRRPPPAGLAGLCAPRVLVDLRPPESFFAISLFHHFHEMPHFMDHAANRWGVFALDHLMHPAQPESPNRLPHVVGAADKADHPLDLDGATGLLAGGGFLFASH